MGTGKYNAVNAYVSSTFLIVNSNLASVFVNKIKTYIRPHGSRMVRTVNIPQFMNTLNG